jgi:hypothetical protein
MGLSAVESAWEHLSKAIAACGAVWKALKGLISKHQREVHELQERVRQLESELQSKDEFSGPNEHGYLFYKDRPTQPLCPKCTQLLPPHPVFMGPIEPGNGGSYRDCLICHERIYENAERHLQPARIGRPRANEIRRRGPV